jgi:hypothetical protein
MPSLMPARSAASVNQPYENDQVDESETRAAPALFSKTKLLSLRELKAEVKSGVGCRKVGPAAAVEPATFRSGAIPILMRTERPTKIAVELSDSPSIRAFQVTEAQRYLTRSPRLAYYGSVYPVLYCARKKFLMSL